MTEESSEEYFSFHQQRDYKVGHHKVEDPELFSVVEADDPFDIGAFDVRFSLNKKGRWNISNQLISGINSYQVRSNRSV
ncbi:unnamed protein product [Gongylonema pulchrum]|uniref:Transposase n=1 Tax=Gongylonema pulchrum TaxID=637853 RepID=A0A183DCG2_9BILA|nr:unnamed protein product [Gongylonema pulchrum]